MTLDLQRLPEAMQQALEQGASAGLWMLAPGIDPMSATFSTLGLGRSRRRPGEPEMVGDVAVFDICGRLSKYPSIWRIFGWGSQPTLPELAQEIDRAAADPAVGSILLRIDSPGGTVAGAEAAAESVFRARSSKRVVAFADDQTCSCAMWLASQAEEIVAGPSAVLGSIGTFYAIVDASKAFGRDGYEVVVISTGGVKGLGVYGAEVTGEHKKELQRLAGEIQERFTAGLARGRGLSVESVQAMVDGRSYVGAHAVERGLADRVAHFPDLLSEMTGKAASKSAAEPQPENEEPEDDPAEGGSVAEKETETTEETNPAPAASEESPAPEASERAESVLERAEATQAAADRRMAELEERAARAEVREDLAALADRVPPAVRDGGLQSVMEQLKQAGGEGYEQLKASLEKLPALGLTGRELAGSEAEEKGGIDADLEAAASDLGLSKDELAAAHQQLHAN